MALIKTMDSILTAFRNSGRSILDNPFSIQLTLPKSNPWDWRNCFDLCGVKNIENKEKRTWIDLRLRRLFDLCEFDLGRVDCILLNLIFRVHSEVGQVYMLINNAGILVGESLLELREGDIRRTIEINLLSAFWVNSSSFSPSTGHLWNNS